jgi:hypothetical protein
MKLAERGYGVDGSQAKRGPRSLMDWWGADEHPAFAIYFYV